MLCLFDGIVEQVGRPVVDTTGLTGNYDITLDWTPERGDEQFSSAGDGNESGALPPDSI